jgi:DNA-binding NarL/FixJ family response regulator
MGDTGKPSDWRNSTTYQTSKLILIADDNALVRKLLRGMLERDGGWEVAGARDGQEAVLKAQELKPDAVILDLAMPVMDGLDAAREIGKKLPSAPIILFTIHDSPETTLAATQAGVACVFPKTGSGHGLIKTVEELLAKEYSAPKSPRANA